MKEITELHKKTQDTLDNRHIGLTSLTQNVTKWLCGLRDIIDKTSEGINRSAIVMTCLKLHYEQGVGF